MVVVVPGVVVDGGLVLVGVAVVVDPGLVVVVVVVGGAVVEVVLVVVVVAGVTLKGSWSEESDRPGKLVTAGKAPPP